MKSALSAARRALGLSFLAATGFAVEPGFQVHPERLLQVVRGLGFEIQSDSIGSGNQGLPDNRIAVPHDLTPTERTRLAEEMLKGFRYCRLAGGLYWRGLDPEQKVLRPRWPEQLEELRELLQRSKVEGVCFEYWSPAPFWKGSRSYLGAMSQDPLNRLRCFAPGFADDPEYRGDTDRFLADFAQAVAADLRTLQAAGLNPVMFGLQNEPYVNHHIYSSCEYPDAAGYAKAFVAVASAIRKLDPKILLFADTGNGFPQKIAPGMRNPEVAGLVDAYAVHIVGASSENVRQVHTKITADLPPRPWFQNEYEYLDGGATPERCLNTVQHIMNSFQLAGNPTWFWLHALKPFKNAEASGYSLGFWRSLEEPPHAATSLAPRRWRDGPELAPLAGKLSAAEMISATRGDPAKPGVTYDFSVNQPVTVFLLVQDCGSYTPGAAWEAAAETAPSWAGGRDKLYRRAFPAGPVVIPAHTGREGDHFGAPHLAFVAPSEAATFKAMIGVNVPIQIRSEFLALERATADLAPGHWMFNRYNWNAVGSFAKRLPWDSTVVTVDESNYAADARILAFRRPNGKLTVVVSNRTASERAFTISTSRPGSAWHGYRYTPDEAGSGTLGVFVGESTGPTLQPVLPRLSWEFWEER
jgi:Glycosyl hydrolase family 30 beta sandwich domain